MTHCYPQLAELREWLANQKRAGAITTTTIIIIIDGGGALSALNQPV